MNTIIHYIGDLKEQAYRDLANEFEKRLSAYTKLTNTESKSDDGIIASLKDRSYKIAMCIEGKQLSSEEFAALKNMDLSIAAACFASTCFDLTDAQTVRIIATSTYDEVSIVLSRESLTLIDSSAESSSATE